MRIIAGKLKGRRLFAPRDKSIRPTTDRVKEALFSIMDSHTNYYNKIVIDLFSGTGNLGIEAISRGASLCYFGDINRESIKLIKSNIEHCKGASEKSKVLPGDYKRALKKISDDGSKATVIIVDPPYNENLIEKAILEIGNLDLLEKGGIIICEHHKRDVLSEEIGPYKKIKEKKYGIIVLSIYV